LTDIKSKGQRLPKGGDMTYEELQNFKEEIELLKLSIKLEDDTIKRERLERELEDLYVIIRELDENR